MSIRPHPLAAVVSVRAVEIFTTDLHRVLVDRLAAAESRVTLCSPFIGAEPAGHIAAAAGNARADWRLLTVLNARNAAYGSLSLDGLRAMADAGVDIRHLSRLHAKVFLADDGVGYLGSANLTRAGLGLGDAPNYEMSAEMTPEQRVAAAAVLAGWWEMAVPVTADMIEKCRAEAARVPVLPDELPDGDSMPVDRAEIAASLSAECGRARAFVKALYEPLGTSDGGDTWFQSVHRWTPSFEVGDFVALYERAHGCCTTVVQVSGDSRRDPQFIVDQGHSPESAGHWPWVTPVRLRLRVSPSSGVPLSLLGRNAAGLQRGHFGIDHAEMATVIRHMVEPQAIS